MFPHMNFEGKYTFSAWHSHEKKKNTLIKVRNEGDGYKNLSNKVYVFDIQTLKKLGWIKTKETHQSCTAFCDMCLVI
jgi:hypothetical protein